MQSNIPFRNLLHYLRGQIILKMNYKYVFDIPLCLKLVYNCRQHKLLFIIIGFLQYMATYVGHFQPNLNMKLKTILYVTNTLIV